MTFGKLELVGRKVPKSTGRSNTWVNWREPSGAVNCPNTGPLIVSRNTSPSGSLPVNSRSLFTPGTFETNRPRTDPSPLSVGFFSANERLGACASTVLNATDAELLFSLVSATALVVSPTNETVSVVEVGVQSVMK